MISESQSLPLSVTLQSYVSSHPSTVLLDPLPAMTQLLDRFASCRIMSKLHNSLRGEMQFYSPNTVVCFLIIDFNTCLLYFNMFNRLAYLQSSLPRNLHTQWPVIHSTGGDGAGPELPSQSVHSLSVAIHSCTLVIIFCISSGLIHFTCFFKLNSSLLLCP